MAPALLAFAAALCVASFTWILARRDVATKREVEACRRQCAELEREVERIERDRADLRRRNELVVAALLKTLPREDRIELLAAIGEAVPRVN